MHNQFVYNDRHILKALKREINPIALFQSMGMGQYTINSRGELRCACFIHGGTNCTAFRGNLEKNRFTCYTERCVVSGDVFDVATAKFGATGVKYVVDFGRPWTDEERKDVDFKIANREKCDQPPPTQALVDRYASNDLDCWLYRGIMPTVINRFELGYSPNNETRMIMPLRDENGTLYGLQARIADSVWLQFAHIKKHLNYPTGMPKCSHVYGLYQALNMKRDEERTMRNPPRRDTFIILEGNHCALASHQAAELLEGSSDWTPDLEMVGAAMGAEISRQQALLIAKHFGKVIVIPDWDADTSTYKESLVESTRRHLEGWCSIYRVNLPPELGVKDWGTILEKRRDPNLMAQLLKRKKFVA